MRMFDKLRPKEEKYFEHFHDMIAHIIEMADLTHTLFSTLPYPDEIVLRLKPLESRCDEIQSKVTRNLNKTFVTPFDREDIHKLISELAGISDTLFAAAMKRDVSGLTERVDGADRLTLIVSEQMKELAAAMEDLKDKSKGMNECQAVRDLESEADNIYREAMRRLFAEEKDPVTLIKKKEILEILERASDECQTVANVIVSIFIKNS